MIDLPTSPIVAAYIRQIRSAWKVQFFYLKNLPTAFWWGFRVKHADLHRTEVTIPYNWRTKNPYRSIYFAALAGAGELSTGILANMAKMDKGNISMLVLEQRAEFVKKATTLTTFTCEQGMEVQNVVKKAVETGEPQVITMKGTGRNTSGEVVCHIYITWTFKAKSDRMP